MSTTSLEKAQTPPCDDLLDYVYGELPPSKKKAFEDHLATCAKCQDEVNATTRLRNLTREALPKLEPAADRMAAIQAQVLLAAAQQKSGGKVIPFLRKIASHPGYTAMAATFVVGAFIVTQLTTLKMPSPPASSATAPAAAPVSAAEAPATTATTIAAPTAPDTTDTTPINLPPAPPQGDGDGQGKYANKNTYDRRVAPTVAKADPSKQQPSLDDVYAAKKDSPSDAELFKKESRADSKQKKSLGDDGSLAGVRGGDDSTNAPSAYNSNVSGNGNVARHAASGPPGSAPTDASATNNGYAHSGKKMGGRASNIDDNMGVIGGEAGGAGSSARMAEAKPAEEKSAPAEIAIEGQTRSKAPAATAPKPKAATNDEYYRNQDQKAKGKSEPSAPPVMQQTIAAAPAPVATPTPTAAPASAAPPPQQSNFAGLTKQQREQEVTSRKRGESYARSGRCEDALHSFNEANRNGADANQLAQDQLTYARCLREAGRYDAAQIAIDNLKRSNTQQNVVSERTVDIEQDALTNQRRSAGAGQKSSPMAAPRKSAAKPAAAPATKNADMQNAY